jgi:hypothetical protein
MITLAIHENYFLLTKIKLIKHLLNIVEEFKMKKVTIKKKVLIMERLMLQLLD